MHELAIQAVFTPLAWGGPSRAKKTFKLDIVALNIGVRKDPHIFEVVKIVIFLIVPSNV